MSYNWNFDSTPADRVAQYQKLTQLWATVRQRTPNSGTYLVYFFFVFFAHELISGLSQNEADVFEPDFQTSFWGPNYARLLQIKNK